MIRLIFKDNKIVVFKDADNKWIAFGGFPAGSDALQYLQREAKKQVIFNLLTGQMEWNSVHEADECITRIVKTPKFDYYYGNFDKSDLEEVLQAADDFLQKQEDEI